MRVRPWALSAASVVALAVTGAAGGAANRDPGPPPYVSFPHLDRIEDTPAAERGQFVFGPDGLMPAPFVPVIAPMTGGFQQGTLGGTQTVSGTTDSTSALDSYQGEPMLVAGNGLLVGGQNDIFPSNCNAAAATGAFGDCGPSSSVSTDGGAIWTRTKLPRRWSNHTFLLGFDPSIAFDGTTFFYAYGVADSGNNAPNGIVVVSSSDGKTWTQKTPVTLSTKKTNVFDDKYWIAADRTSGNLYVGWDRNQGNNQTLFVAVSTNHAVSWSAPIKVNDGTTSFERVIDAMPAVDQATHTVYMSWHDYAKNKIFVDKSTDGGLHWGPDVAATTTHTGFGIDIGCNGARKMSPAQTLLVAPSGTLYVVYADSVAGNGYDILIVKSTDQGATWSAPVRVNDDAVGTGRHQYNAGASIDALTGDLTVSWLDRRDDPANCLTSTYASRSADGTTWSTNENVTSDGKGPAGTGQSNFDGNPNGPGDYAGGASVTVTPPLGTPFSEGHPYFARHVDTETGTAGAFEIYSSIVTP
jgi:hypothetical protein